MLHKGKTFEGANVFMSRNLVPPDVFDALLDALKQNGAQVFLCCDPSRNGPNDFHVISSPDHDKFQDLRAKGCHFLGPQCVLSCAKEHRVFPRKGFTCCLAMDSVKVLASGFDMDEKVQIENMVTGMGGLLLTRTSLDVNFVIVKNVLAAKYKWALNTLKKPIVTLSWLHQCWNEHRVVPQEPYRVLPFSGLTISLTNIQNRDERKMIEEVTIQNGGKYSPELTRMCTHLIADAPTGDKYKVAQRWGHIHIVTRKWFDQSVARRACLNEESYHVQGGSLSSSKTVGGSSTAQPSQPNCTRILQSVTSSMTAESTVPHVAPGNSESDLETMLLQNMTSMFSDPSEFTKEVNDEVTTVHTTNETKVDGCVASDSQSEENDEYLSECIIALAGFEASELGKLVSMVRRGGGSRRVVSNDKLTHIVVGAPSEAEKEELRGLAASGVINVVKSTWLKDCDHDKKEVPILGQHVAYELLKPKDSESTVKGVGGGLASVNHGKFSVVRTNTNSDHISGGTYAGNGMPSSMDKDVEARLETNMSRGFSSERTLRCFQKNLFPVRHDEKERKRKKCYSSDQNIQNTKSSVVFKEKTFRFSESFPEDRRAEIFEWISQAGGIVAGDHATETAQFTIECHGVVPRSTDVIQTTYVSSHWVRSCLKDGSLLDVNSHIIYSPLPCQVPLPAFENLRFCISQYDDKDRLLLRNLCYILGAKFVEKLTRNVTHLLCKFTNGPKYEAACKWGICSITCEWIYECIRQNVVVAVDLYQPKEVTSQDQEAGLCTVSQFPTEATQMVSGEHHPSQLMSQSQDHQKTSQKIGNGIDRFWEEAQQSNNDSKKARLLENDDQKNLCSSIVHANDSIVDSGGLYNLKDNGESLHGVSDVAASIEEIEGLYELDKTSLGRNGCEKNLFPSECSIVAQDHRGSESVIGLPKPWPNRTGKKDGSSNPSKNTSGGIYDNFSETPTDSQVVGYEEDLSGRQMLIERVRTRGSNDLN